MADEMLTKNEICSFIGMSLLGAIIGGLRGFFRGYHSSHLLNTGNAWKWAIAGAIIAMAIFAIYKSLSILEENNIPYLLTGKKMEDNYCGHRKLLLRGLLLFSMGAGGFSVGFFKDCAHSNTFIHMKYAWIYMLGGVVTAALIASVATLVPSMP
jgi:hypothetical protein